MPPRRSNAAGLPIDPRRLAALRPPNEPTTIPRIVKAHAVRRDELLDAATLLLARKGYEQLTVQDVIAHCGIAKGTLYHYFDSKQALLLGVIERLHDAVEAVLAPQLDDHSGTVVATLSRSFAAASAWERSNTPLLVALLPSLLKEENVALLRHVRTGFDTRLRPRLVALVERARAEGLSPVADPENTADLLLGVWATSTLTIPRLLARPLPSAALRERLRELVSAHERATERLLGAPRGELRVIDDDAIDAWVTALCRPAEGA